MLTALLFILVLGVLVFVHELGHFLVAKKAGIRVDEFALGFPPRLWSKKIGETVYALNCIPFGGYVKIFGENAEESEAPETAVDFSRNFAHKNRAIQAAVLLAGVTANMVFAWLIISIGYMSGMPVPVGSYADNEVLHPHVVVTSVTLHSPADVAKIHSGDTLVSLEAKGVSTPHSLIPEDVSSFVAAHGTDAITVTVLRGGVEEKIVVTPTVSVDLGRPAIGIGMDLIGTATFSPLRAIIEGGKTTIDLTKSIFIGLYDFFSSLFHFQAKLSDVTGPIGIATVVGDAASLGFVNLLMITAFISINLAVINVMPFPALDGGRLLFVAIEAVRRKSLPQRFTILANSIGFALLIALMVVVTYKDIARFF